MIRTADDADADALADLHRTSITQLCQEHYSSEQISAWTAPLRPELYRALMGRVEVSVFEEQGRLLGLGISDAGDALINAIYVHPDATRRNVGRALLMHLETAILERGLNDVRLNATLNAVGFYERMGYTRVDLAMNKLANGVELPCVSMTKLLEE
jgi:putative acetyltransferase